MVNTPKKSDDLHVGYNVGYMDIFGKLSEVLLCMSIFLPDRPP
jgi:hypothetical protein